MTIIPEVLESNFAGLSINDFIVMTNHIADKQEQHTLFKEGPLPEYVTRSPQLRQLAGELGLARDAAAGGDRDNMAAKKALRELVQQALTVNAVHVTLVALHRKDPSLMLGAGYEFKQKASGKAASINLLDCLPDLHVKHAPGSGGVYVNLRGRQGTASFELQMTSGEPSDESSWKSLGIYSKSRVDLRDLEPAKRYHFRVRYHDAGRTGKWSAVASIIVL